MNDRRHERGFSLVELAITVLVLGMLFGFSIPALRSLSSSQQLVGATENVAAQLRLARERAIASGTDQPVRFSGTASYFVDLPGGTAWTLPQGITFATSMNTTYTMKRDGRSSGSGAIVLRDARGIRDTVSIQLSGLVLTK
jgi:prepilin-type N-terminal cleavage/methylation domain-containing protein